MNLPKNGVAKEIRSYSGALLIFLFIVALVVVFIQYPVLDSNKEVVMMLVGTLSASLAMVISTITGSKPDDINALKSKLDSKEQTIESLTKSKDEYESMIIKLQKDMLKNQDDMFDKFILKQAMDFDDKNNSKK
jgi:low affinity Fe/Cu permease